MNLAVSNISNKPEVVSFGKDCRGSTAAV